MDTIASDPCRLSLPVEGMSCAGCVSRVERALTTLPGARDVAVNLATRRASLVLEDGTGPGDVAAALAAAGYPVASTETVLPVEGMHCASCVGRVEKALTSIPGVTGASVNLAAGQARVTHGEGVVAPADLAAAVTGAGFTVPAAAEAAPEAREDRRAAEARALRQDFGLAALLSAPVVILDMGGHFGAHAFAGANGTAGAVVQAVLTTLVLAWPGRRFFRAGIPGLLRGIPT